MQREKVGFEESDVFIIKSEDGVNSTESINEHYEAK